MSVWDAWEAEQSQGSTFVFAGKTWTWCDGEQPKEIKAGDLVDYVMPEELSMNAHASYPCPAEWVNWRKVAGWRRVDTPR